VLRLPSTRLRSVADVALSQQNRRDWRPSEQTDAPTASQPDADSTSDCSISACSNLLSIFFRTHNSPQQVSCRTAIELHNLLHSQQNRNRSNFQVTQFVHARIALDTYGFKLSRLRVYIVCVRVGLLALSSASNWLRRRGPVHCADWYSIALCCCCCRRRRYVVPPRWSRFKIIISTTEDCIYSRHAHSQSHWHLWLLLLCSRPIRPQYTGLACPSVGSSVRRVWFHNSKTQKLWRTQSGVNVTQCGSNGCANFRSNRLKLEFAKLYG